jgi:hypothetical protein
VVNHATRPLSPWAILALAAALGCDGQRKTISYAQFAMEYPAAECQLEVTCGNDPDVATCLSINPLHFYMGSASEIAAGRMAYDGVKAAACIDALNTSPCTFLGMANESKICNSVVAGAVSIGGACVPGDCAGWAYCRLADPGCSAACCVGTCQPSPDPPQPVGAACTVGVTNCASPSFCVAPSSVGVGTCRLLASTGDSCASVPCDALTYCDPVSTTCRVPAVDGYPCNPALGGMDCEDYVGGCNPTTSLCTGRLPIGAACDPSHNFCVGYAFCDGATSLCVPMGSVGEGCGATRPCLYGLSCDATTSICTVAPSGGGVPPSCP